MELLISFARSNTVYSTTNTAPSGHPENKEFGDDKHRFHEIELFKNQNINIIQIATGANHTLFLDDTGCVWLCGKTQLLGFSEEKVKVLGKTDPDGGRNRFTRFTHIPRLIEYFVVNDIKIKDIQCGYEHSLALDMNGRIYSWGNNGTNECGDYRDGVYSTHEPKLIKYFADNEYIVDVIKCGSHHSYARTECGKHVLFGENGDNECMTFGKLLNEPNCINEIVMEKCKVKEILDVVPGAYNTKVIGILQ